MDKSRHLYLTEFSEAVVSDLRRNVYIFSVPHICSMAVIRPGITVLSSGGWMHLKVYYSHIGSATRFDSLLFIPDKFSEVLLSSRQGESPRKTGLPTYLVWEVWKNEHSWLWTLKSILFYLCSWLSRRKFWILKYFSVHQEHLCSLCNYDQ